MLPVPAAPAAPPGWIAIRNPSYTSQQMPIGKTNPERLVSAARAEEENSFELKLRPRLLNEFIGQPKAKELLAIALQAAKSRGEALDHVLLFGPPGLGKTTLASIIANELDVGFQQTSGPALQIQGDLTAILTNLRERQVLFLDEIHRLQPVLEEKLYTALEDYKLDIIIGQGPAARTHVMEIKPFTFVAATTRPGLLSSPLRSRFGILLRLEFYSEDDLRYIVERSAEVMNVPIDQDGAAEIAMRSRGTPRIANRLLRRVRDYAQVRGTGTIDRPTAEAALKMLEVDAHGFDELDRRLLLTIIEKYDGGPVGLNTLAATLAEEEDALEEVYEPFLIQIGFLDRTPRGRMATRLAYEHFGLHCPPNIDSRGETARSLPVWKRRDRPRPAGPLRYRPSRYLQGLRLRSGSSRNQTCRKHPLDLLPFTRKGSRPRGRVAPGSPCRGRTSRVGLLHQAPLCLPGGAGHSAPLAKISPIHRGCPRVQRRLPERYASWAAGVGGSESD